MQKHNFFRRFFVTGRALLPGRTPSGHVTQGRGIAWGRPMGLREGADPSPSSVRLPDQLVKSAKEKKRRQRADLAEEGKTGPAVNSNVFFRNLCLHERTCCSARMRGSEIGVRAKGACPGGWRSSSQMYHSSRSRAFHLQASFVMTNSVTCIL